MVKRKRSAPANNLRAWREYRQLTQDELAALIGTNGSVISLLESGTRGLSLKWLQKLAPALKTKPGILLDHDPNDLDTAILEIWANVPDNLRPLARENLATFAKKNSA
jgi:transcriptional regulator with XRE-family HTH domain